MSAEGDPLVLVVIGDSIPYDSGEDCPNFIGFADTVAAEIEQASGKAATVRNLARHDGATTGDIADQLTQDARMIEQRAKADVVITSFGFNDQPPCTSGAASCPLFDDAASDEVLFETMAKISTECIDAQTAALTTAAQTLLEQLRSLAPGASIAVLNSHNSWIGWERLESDFPESTQSTAATTSHALGDWSAALCAEATAIDTTCVDIDHHF
ncbi:MAG: GDSL-type esterase/lipase family protein, partial [Microbacteriaceae bacterium]|nr:GDSL-type esterase/lipase family protein [Microbacteriaceae bacterium]